MADQNKVHQFKSLLAFLILMGGASVLSKSPDYIAEKFQRAKGKVEGVHPDDNPAWALDAGNLAIYNQYLQDWGIA